MSTFVGAKTLDEESWQAWMRKGRENEERGNEARVRAAKWVAAGALLAGAALWSYLAPYDTALRFVVSLGAVIMMFQAFHARRFAYVAVFGVLVLLYNPVVPIFGLSGAWQRVLVVASAVPFAASLVWRNAKQVRND